MKVYLHGDFKSETGPGIANRSLKKSFELNTGVIFSKKSNKILRFIESVYKTIICRCVFLCGFSESNFIVLKTSKLLNKPVFYYMHGCIKIESQINFKKENKIISKEEFLLDKVDKIICVSNMQKNSVIKSYNKYQKKIIVNYNCMEIDKFVFSNKKRKKDRKYLIVSTGGGMPRKANLIICKAIQKINKQLSKQISYIVIGDSFGKLAEFRQFQFVEYHEKLPHEEVLEYMKKSDLYIQNSQYETFGLAVLEALLQGTDILISKNVGALEVFKELVFYDVINDINDINEIAQKIVYVLTHHNAQRLYNSINLEMIDIEKNGRILLDKLNVG